MKLAVSVGTLVASTAALLAPCASAQSAKEEPKKELTAASDWSQWRGPLGTGESPDATPPLTWSESKNVRFKVAVAGESLASPILWGDKLFLLTAVSQDNAAYKKSVEAAQEVFDSGEWPPKVEPVKQQFIIEARSPEDGRVLWSRIAREGVPHESHYLDSSFACASAVTDGELVYAHFGSNGTYAYTLDGKLSWQVDLGNMTTRRGFGEGSSPAIAGDALIINWDHEGDSFIVALDKRTGKVMWRTDRPGEVTSWATPLIVPTKTETQVIVPATGFSRGYNVKDGREIWRLAGMTTNTIPTPVHRDGIVYLASGYRGTMMQAVALDGAKGDLAGTPSVRWTYDRDTPYVASVLLMGDQLYFAKHFRSVFSSINATTGENLYTTRLPGIHNVYASPLGANGRVYLFGRGGTSLVIRQGPEFEVLATNVLDDGIDATPAIIGNDLYIRGRHHLYRIAETPE